MARRGTRLGGRATRLASALWLGATMSLGAALADDSIDERSSYSYVRALEGRATLASVGEGPGAEADLNQPLLAGDTVRVERGARIEVALADRNVLRVGGASTVALAQIAFSADREDRSTRLELQEGELVLWVTESALGDELPEIRTAAGRVFVHEPGRYRLRAEPGGELEVVVREGMVELLTERGATVVRAGEEAWIGGDRWATVRISAAGPLDALERWGSELERPLRTVATRTLHVEPDYAYAAAPLDSYGSWIYVDDTWCWRPRVTVDWRPYWNGRWIWTPSGLTWISAEPWGWLPYHYGSWTRAAGYGWVWRPGRVYSPAWVYWYVGADWTGWCPVGYYLDYYRARRTGFRFGVYGWTGGSWGLYADWNFIPTRRVLDRDGRRWHRTGTHVGRLAGQHGPRGILTTDTRTRQREDWRRADRIPETLAGKRWRGLDEAPVVTDFVARRPKLGAETEQAIAPGLSGSSRRLDPVAMPSSGFRGRTPGEEAPAWRRREGSRSTEAGMLPPRATPRGGERGRPELADRPGARPVTPRGGEVANGGPSDESWPRLRGGFPDARRQEPGDRQGWRRDDRAPTLSFDPPPGFEPGARSGRRLPEARGTAPHESTRTESPAGRVVGGIRKAQPERPYAGFDRSTGRPRVAPRSDDSRPPGATVPRVGGPAVPRSGAGGTVRNRPSANPRPGPAPTMRGGGDGGSRQQSKASGGGSRQRPEKKSSSDRPPSRGKRDDRDR